MKHLAQHANGLYLLTAVVVLIVSCSKSEFTKSGNEQRKQVGIQQASSDVQQATPLARAIYQLEVKANTNMTLCSGLAQFIMYDNTDLKPSGELNCLTGSVPLSNLFGQPDNVVYKSEDLSRYRAYGKIRRKQNPEALVPGTASFTPPKPAIIGPVVQNIDDFRDFVFSEGSSVTGITLDGESYTGTGQWFFQVLDILDSYTVPGYDGPLNFNSVLKWEVKGVGFDGVPRSKIMAYDSMIYHVSTRDGDKQQMVIARIEIKTKLSEVAGSMGPGVGEFLGKMGDVFFSGVHITLDLREYNPL